MILFRIYFLICYICCMIVYVSGVFLIKFDKGHCRYGSPIVDQIRDFSPMIEMYIPIRRINNVCKVKVQVNRIHYGMYDYIINLHKFNTINPQVNLIFGFNALDDKNMDIIRFSKNRKIQIGYLKNDKYTYTYDEIDIKVNGVFNLQIKIEVVGNQMKLSYGQKTTKPSHFQETIYDLFFYPSSNMYLIYDTDHSSQYNFDLQLNESKIITSTNNIIRSKHCFGDQPERNSDWEYFLFGPPPNTTTHTLSDHFCLIHEHFIKDDNTENNIAVTMKLIHNYYNSNLGTVGIFFNYIDDDNFDFLYFTVDNIQKCYTHGAVIKDIKTIRSSGICPTIGPPQIGSNITIQLIITKYSVIAKLHDHNKDVSVVLGKFDSINFMTNKFGGLMASTPGAIGVMSKISLLEMFQSPSEPSPLWTVQDCHQDSQLNKIYKLSDRYSMGGVKNKFCRVILRDADLDLPYEYSIDVKQTQLVISIIFDIKDDSFREFNYLTLSFHGNSVYVNDILGYVTNNDKDNRGVSDMVPSSPINVTYWLNVKVRVYTYMAIIFINGNEVKTVKCATMNAKAGIGLHMTDDDPDKIYFRNPTIRSLEIKYASGYEYYNCLRNVLQVHDGYVDKFALSISKEGSSFCSAFPPNMLYNINYRFSVEIETDSDEFGVLFNVIDLHNYHKILISRTLKKICLLKSIADFMKVEECRSGFKNPYADPSDVYRSIDISAVILGELRQVHFTLLHNDETLEYQFKIEGKVQAKVGFTTKNTIDRNKFEFWKFDLRPIDSAYLSKLRVENCGIRGAVDNNGNMTIIALKHTISDDHSFCKVLFYPNMNTMSYTYEQQFKVISSNPKGYSHVGLTYNVKDVNNFDFILLIFSMVQNASICYLNAASVEGIIIYDNSLVGQCSVVPGFDQDFKISLSSRNASGSTLNFISMANDNIATEMPLNNHFEVHSEVGLLIENGLDTMITFKMPVIYEVKSGKCEFIRCKNGGRCVEDIQYYKCVCRTGYFGLHCDYMENICTGLSPCKNRASCINTGRNIYKCNCANGFAGVNCNIKTESCKTDPCHNGATCRVDQMKAILECLCLPGFRGIYCDIIGDACRPSPCKGQQSTCTLLPADHFSCNCSAGLTGLTCDKDIEECLSSPCLNGECHDYTDYFNCTCKSGFTGIFCESDIDSCLSFPCENKAYCHDLSDGYSCLCPFGFTGVNCAYNMSACQQDVCHNYAKCQLVEHTFKCDCLSGFMGMHCEHRPKDFCVKYKCYNGASCFNNSCFCTKAFKGIFCNETATPCGPPTPCKNGGLCRIEGMDFECDCPNHYAGKHCQLLSTRCIDQAICLPAATYCFLNGNDFKCICAYGYSGTICESKLNAHDPTGKVDNCLSVPCKNAARCLNQRNNYTCRCLYGYFGSQCEKYEIRKCADGHDLDCLNGGMCAIDPFGRKSCHCLQFTTGKQCESLYHPCFKAKCPDKTECVVDFKNNAGYRCKVLEIFSIYHLLFFSSVFIILFIIFLLVTLKLKRSGLIEYSQTKVINMVDYTKSESFDKTSRMGSKMPLEGASTLK